MSNFYGINLAAQASISTGIERLQVPSFPLSQEQVESLNYNTAVYAKARPRLQQAWAEAIAKGYNVQEKVRVVPAKNRTYTAKRKAALHRAAKVYEQDFRLFNLYSLGILILSFGLVLWGQAQAWDWWKILRGLGLFSFIVIAFDVLNLVKLRQLPQIVQHLREMLRFQIWGWVYALALVVGLVYAFTQWALVSILALLALVLAGWVVALSIFKTTKILNIWTQLSRLHDAHSFFRHAAEALLASMRQREIISGEQDPSLNHLVIEAREEDVFELVPGNLDTHSTQLYLSSLQELLGPVDNPRYLLALQYNLDEEEPLVYYFPVPQALGKQKKDAEALLEVWQEKLGPTELIYTRSPMGRMALLKARGQGFGAQPGEYMERVSDWE
jgi:hypothetical protein